MKRGILAILTALALLCGAAACAPAGPATFTVAFDTAGGEEIAPQTVERGGKAEEPMEPINGSKEFAGWYRESSYTTPWDFDEDTVEADLTLYAKFDSTFTVTFYKSAQADSTPFTTQKVVEGRTARSVDYLSAALKADGWYTDVSLSANAKYDFSAPVTRDLKLYPEISLKTKWTFPADRAVGGTWGIVADLGTALGRVTEFADCIRVELDPGSWTNYLKSPDLGIALNDSRTSIKLRYKNLSDLSNLKIFFTTVSGETASDWNGANFPVLKKNMTEADDWAEATVDMKQAFGSKWTNSLWNLRFELKTAEQNPPLTGTMLIQSIELVPSPAAGA